MHAKRFGKLTLFSTILLASMTTILAGTVSSAIDTTDAASEPPIAKATDLEFIVEYSTDKLMAGDILFARATIRNKTDRTVRMSEFDTLVIRAKTAKVTELVAGFGEYPGGTMLIELEPGKEIVSHRALDVFGNDGYENGTFNPFDTELNGKSVVFHSERSTVMPRHLKELDYRNYVLQNRHQIEFGPPLIERKALDIAIARTLQEERLESLKLYHPLLHQHSYLFTQTDDPKGWSKNDRTFVAALRVFSKQLPSDSSARRAARIILGFNRFVSNNNEPAEKMEISSVISVLQDCTDIERTYWEISLAKVLENAQSRGLVSAQKVVFFENALAESASVE